MTGDEAAQPSDYDAERGVVLLRGTKTRDRWGEVPVLPLLAPLFEFARTRLPLSWPNVSKRLPEAAKRAGVGHISPKDLRRTAATWLLESGADQALVARFLRHRDQRMVARVYGQLGATQLGLLLAEQCKNVTAIAGPLGGMADAGDLKGRPQSTSFNKPASERGSSGSVAERNGASKGTLSSQPIPAAVARALAAEPDPAAVALAEAYRAAMAGDEAATLVALAKCAAELLDDDEARHVG